MREWALSRRESEVIILIAEGYQSKEIAKRLGLTHSTVKSYVNNIFQKLGARSRAEAVAIYLSRFYLASHKN